MVTTCGQCVFMSGIIFSVFGFWREASLFYLMLRVFKTLGTVLEMNLCALTCVRWIGMFCIKKSHEKETLNFGYWKAATNVCSEQVVKQEQEQKNPGLSVLNKQTAVSRILSGDYGIKTIGVKSRRLPAALLKAIDRPVPWGRRRTPTHLEVRGRGGVWGGIEPTAPSLRGPPSQPLEKTHVLMIFSVCRGANENFKSLFLLFLLFLPLPSSCCRPGDDLRRRLEI